MKFFICYYFLVLLFCSIIQSVENIIENLVDQEDFERLVIITDEIEVRADKVRRKKGLEKEGAKIREIEEGK